MTDTDIKTFSVPLGHPAVCTIVPHSLCVSNPEKFYSVNHCLQRPTCDENELIFTEPAGVINIKNSPVLRGKECISSVDEFKAISNDLLSKPIYAEVECAYSKKKTNLIVETTTTWTNQYCVVVDTQHMYVRATLKRYLDEAMELMEKGIKFCLKFSFASNIRQCLPLYLDPKEANKYGSGCYVSDGLDIYLTNHGRAICDLCTNPCLVLAIFPINIFGGLCYSLHRVATVKDIEYEVKGFPVKFLVDENTLEFIVPEYAYMELRV